MPSLHLYAAFVATVVVLMLIPGPNVALLVATSLRHGVRSGLLAVAGTSSAMAVQLGLTAIGLSSLLGHFSVWFGWIRWLGVIYLLYLGIMAWRAPAITDRAVKVPSSRRLWSRAFMVSLTNPKTLFFYGALLPQFLASGHPFAPQMAVLAGTFLIVALMIDSAWCLVAGWIGGGLTPHGRILHRIGGSFLIGAGIGLALARGDAR